MRPARGHRPSAFARVARSLLGLLALVCVLVLHASPASAGLLAPGGEWASERALGAAKIGAAKIGHWGDGDGEACDDADSPTEQTASVGAGTDKACGSDLEWTIGEPVLVTLLRAFDLQMSEAACSDLLLDIWSGQACEAGSRECGKMTSAVPPSPMPKLASSNASARSSVEALGLGLATCRRLVFVGEGASPTSRDLPPPVPPPKLALH